MSEKELISQLINGHEYAFECLYNLYADKIFKVAVKFGLNNEDAAEIVQDVFIKIWERKEDLRLDLSFNAYLLTISKNFIIKKSRKNTTQIAFQKYYARFQNGVDNSTEDLIVYADLFKITEDFLNLLPTQQKEVFKMSRIEQLSHQEISVRLNLSVRTVENHLYRASAKLKEKLKEYGIATGLLILLFVG